jgi:hypothetical protein
MKLIVDLNVFYVTFVLPGPLRCRCARNILHMVMSMRGPPEARGPGLPSLSPGPVLRHLLCYFFMVYLTALSTAQTVALSDRMINE